MIRPEDLRNAIHAISEEDPEIGYALHELMSANQIGLPLDASVDQTHPCFLFQGERVYVRKVSFFNHGTAPLEERLVLKYGEAAEKHLLEEAEEQPNYIASVKRIRLAGLDRLVRFEIKRATAKLRRHMEALSGNRPDSRILEQRLERLSLLLRERSPEQPLDENHPGIIYSAEIEPNVLAHFLSFPFSFEALRQVAEMNLEFFHLRFLLDLFMAGESKRLYASASRERLTGLILLEEKRRLFCSGLEVSYMATINGVPLDAENVSYPRIRGTGTFLMAGAWMIWKEFYPKASEILLDAEFGAARFYKNIGLDFIPPYRYVLRKPRGKLLLYIVSMAMNRPSLPAGLQKSIIEHIEKQLKYLKKSYRANDYNRKISVFIVMSCTLDRPNRSLAATIQDLIEKYRGSIPEGEVLIQGLRSPDARRARQILTKGASMVLTVCDPIFEQHLKGVFHLESRKRIQALESILAEEPFPACVIRIPPRAASEQELAWVHDTEYISKIAATSGHRLCSLDPDTQTTPGSYATARFAVGAVFSLIDEVYNQSTWHHGIACIRPPGHHAEPDRAMGFCLFNNAALGAEYLKRRHAAKRVLIVDIDVHHGNGTQRIFYSRPDVLYFSIHQFPCYPGTGGLGEIGEGEGEGYTINVPLAKGRGDREYAKILHFLLTPVACHYAPEMILVSLGFDMYTHDPLGCMNVTPEGYGLLTHMLKRLAKDICQGRIVFVLEGGYSVDGIRRCGLRVFQELAGLPTLSRDKIDSVFYEKPDSPPELRKAIEVHKKYWPCLK